MEDEIFEEDIIDTPSEIVDDVNVDNSVEEVESTSTYTTDDIISSLLQLLNEQEAADEEEGSDELSSDPIESAPLLVSVEDAIDYTNQLNLLNDKLDNIYTILEEQTEPRGLDTPLNEYNLDSILLLGVLAILLISLGYKFIKDNLLHL